MNKYTPNGWNRNISPASKYPIIFAGRNTHVCQMITRGLSPEEIEANADLVAAAPALAEALIGLVRAADGKTLDVWEALGVAERALTLARLSWSDSRLPEGTT